MISQLNDLNGIVGWYGKFHAHVYGDRRIVKVLHEHLHRLVWNDLHHASYDEATDSIGRILVTPEVPQSGFLAHGDDSWLLPWDNPNSLRSYDDSQFTP